MRLRQFSYSFVMLGVLVCGCAAVVSAQEVTLNTEQWRADLRYLASELPRRHIQAFAKVSPDDWNAEVAALEAEIPTLPDHIIIVRMRRLVTLVGDAHTSVNWNGSNYTFRLYPIGFTNRPDGVFVTAVIYQPVMTMRGPVHYGRAVGMRLVAIGGMPIEEIKRRLLTIVSTDNEYWPTYLFPGLLNVPEVLHALGIIPAMARALYTVEDEAGQQQQLWLTPYLSSEISQLPLAGWPGIRRWTRPLIFTRPSTLNYWYEPLPDRQAVYFRYVRCQEMASQSFASFAQELLNVINTSNAQRLIVDLRGNPGGNSEVINPLFNALLSHRLNQRYSLFVLIDNGTASSAMLNANRFQLLTRATLIGEPTGGKPNAPGEVLSFRLPNSNLLVNYSTRLFTLRPAENLPAISPDVFVQFPWSAYAAGRDPVLEAALND